MGFQADGRELCWVDGMVSRSVAGMGFQDATELSDETLRWVDEMVPQADTDLVVGTVAVAALREGSAPPHAGMWMVFAGRCCLQSCGPVLLSGDPYFFSYIPTFASLLTMFFLVMFASVHSLRSTAMSTGVEIQESRSVEALLAAGCTAGVRDKSADVIASAQTGAPHVSAPRSCHDLGVKGERGGGKR
jgi:hypothetical protein